MTEREKLLKLARMADEKGDIDTAKKALIAIKELDAPKTRLTDEFSISSRPFELTGRYLAESAGGLADLVTSPVKAGANLLGGNYQTDTYSRAVSEGLDNFGVASPETGPEKVVGQASKLLAAGGPFVKSGQLLSKAPGVVGNIGKVLSSQPRLQAVSAGSAGASGEFAKQKGASPLGQFGASLLGGLTPAAVKGVAGSFKGLLPESKGVQQVLDKIDLKGIPKGSVDRLRKSVDDALKNGDLDSASLRRMVDFARTGATPTQASLTLDPIQKTQQLNLAKIGAQSSNPNLQKLSNVQHSNNRTLISGLDDLSDGIDYDPYLGGQAAIKPVLNKQQGFIEAQKELYASARDESGRALPLDRTSFINRVDDLLAQENKTAFLPKPIKKMINTISQGVIGKGESQREVPFNVDVMDQLKTTLSTAQRSADGNASRALTLVRQALDETQLQGAGDDAILAFDKARAATFALKQWEESSPAIKAIVDGATPDTFMDKFVIGRSASVKDVSKLVDEVSADPNAFNALKMQVAAWIKNQAIPTRVDGEGVLRSASLNTALKKIGDRKLNLFFSPAEVEQIKATNRVAFYDQYQPIGSAVNNSNSATTLTGGLLNFISDRSPTARTAGAAFRGIDSVLNNSGRARQQLNPSLGAPLINPRGALATPLALPLLQQ